MRKLMPFLACLMLVLTTWASIGHATEVAGCLEAPISAATHVDGDADQVPADADNPAQHHHNSCHGHHVGTSTTSAIVVHPLGHGSRLTLGSDTDVTATEPDLARRPPKA